MVKNCGKVVPADLMPGCAGKRKEKKIIGKEERFSVFTFSSGIIAFGLDYRSELGLRELAILSG